MACLSREEGIIMKSTLKLSICERPLVKGVTQALVPEWSGYDLNREVKNALSIYLLEDTFSELELYINFANNKIIDIVEKDCIKKGINLKKFYRGSDGQYHLPQN